MTLVRLRRWLLPASTLTLAVAGLGLLLAGELIDPAPAGQGEAPGLPRPAARPAPRPRAVALAPAPATPAPAARAPRPIAPADLPKPAPTRPRVRESAEALRAVPALTTLVREATLPDRLARLEELLRPLSAWQATDLLLGLLDSELPGDFYEAETLRFLALSRLAEQADPRVAPCLQERLRPGRPRPERLLALQLLLTRDDADRTTVELIARHDPDSVVQAQAQQALGRLQ